MKDIVLEEWWLGRAPEIEDTLISQEIKTQVIVVGAGIAGVAAVRTAVEEGAKVALFERCRKVQARSGDFAVMDSKIAKGWNRDKIDKTEIVNDLMRDMSYKVSQNILKRWADEAGDAFDWYLKAYPDIPVLNSTEETPPTGSSCWVQPRRLPLPEGFHNDCERYKCHQVTAWIRPAHTTVCNKNFALAEASGKVQSYFDTRVVKLLKDEMSGRVNGIIAKTAEGTYIKALAESGVILATGEYMNDPKMLDRFCPGMAGTPKQWTSFDRDRLPSNTGDGHKMAMRIGAKMQDAPPAPCAHHMGNVFGACDFLLLDSRGKRFVNEDIPGQQIGSQIENLPDKTAWQLVDSQWEMQIPHVYPNHGAVCFTLTDQQLDDGKRYDKLCFIDNYIAPKYIHEAVEKGRLLKAGTLEELVDMMGMPKKAALENIRRYNKLCREKKDKDFGKRSDRMFPVETGPFYAAKFKPAVMIAVMGGLQSDEDAHCYDTDGRIIPGLYLAGNVQGNRLAVDYPLTVPGLSHSLALTYGRIAGRNAVRKI